MYTQIKLRPYQEEAIKKALWAKDLPGNDLIVHPVGSGKSVVIAELANALNEPILIFQPNREILQQNLEKLSQYVDRSEIGVYSASVGLKTVSKYTLATIGSVYKKKDDFAHFSTWIIDEANQTNPKSLESMYMKLIDGVKPKKIYGFSASPMRLDVDYRRYGSWKYAIESVHTTKLINRMKGKFWSRMLHVVNPMDIPEYLSFPEYVDLSQVDQEDIPVNKSASDFDLDKYEEMLDMDKVVGAIQLAQKHKSILVFCSSVGQAQELQTVFKGSAVVTGETPKKERAQIVEDFKNGKIKMVLNYGIFTYGFNFPDLEALVLIRPTKSLALYSQMLGRLFRQSEVKKTVYDLSSTVRTLGKAETLSIVKIDNKWEIQTETGLWHKKPLYSYKLKKKEPEKIWG